ncbi:MULTISPECIES: hypothetical protein [Vibrio]|uniref:hypothetical protein n=1 Tax=Vibrio TaxID=662 RepID=UPI002075BC71|nr:MULTISPECIES: hypothetical protein [Vibrio]USD35639.1 hypothetical protein J8Z27_22790 [Vibrio sp. SCSIO 43186]USD72763.1 hypothetical protein J4N41_22795 [Vibrio sp. SCSIO 43139]USD98968.1 hypothetical protein CTT30_23120 [Vibrio coralliilyticus]
MTRQLKVTAYKTESDYANGIAEYVYESEVNEKLAINAHNDFEESGYWLVTTTNEEGKLIH